MTNLKEIENLIAELMTFGEFDSEEDALKTAIYEIIGHENNKYYLSTDGRWYKKDWQTLSQQSERRYL